MKLFQHNIHPSPLILGLLCSRVTRILVILVFVQSWQLYLVTLCLRPLSLLCLHIFRSPNPGIPNQMSESYISSFKSLIPFSLLDQPKSLASICNSSSFQGLLGPFSLLESAKPSAAIYNSSSFQGLLGQTFLFFNFLIGGLLVNVGSHL